MIYELYINGKFADGYLSLEDLFETILLEGVHIVEKEEDAENLLVKVYCED